jgi:O-6-methylguanine DNA methyltransferase
MNDDNLATVEELGDLVAAYLRRVEAPPTLLFGVMARVGLADSYFPIDTPLGPVFVAHNPRGISAVMRADTALAFERSFQERFGRTAYGNPEASAALRKAVIEQLHGRQPKRDLGFDLRELSEFEQAVLRKALEIPRGEVRPYAWVAREIGRPRAVRAVGSALAHNPVPLLIPCHRVVRSDGQVGQYGLGVPNKRLMLETEGVELDEMQELARAGIRFIGSGTTGIYCFPSCRSARRITPRHRHPFHSDREATAAGFRPCRVCRPAAVGE